MGDVSHEQDQSPVKFRVEDEEHGRQQVHGMEKMELQQSQQQKQTSTSSSNSLENQIPSSQNESSNSTGVRTPSPEQNQESNSIENRITSPQQQNKSLNGNRIKFVGNQTPSPRQLKRKQRPTSRVRFEPSDSESIASLPSTAAAVKQSENREPPQATASCLAELGQDQGYRPSSPSLLCVEQINRANSEASYDSAASRNWITDYDALQTISVTSASKMTGLRVYHGPMTLTDKDHKAMAEYSSLQFRPSYTDVFRTWLAQRQYGPAWGRWILVVLVGLCTGMIACLLKQSIQLLDRLRWTVPKAMQAENNIGTAWVLVTLISCAYVVVASLILIFIHPPATGMGASEALAFLNGVVVKGTRNLRYIVFKFFATLGTVSSGLPCAVQGPIIGLGSATGSAIGDFRSKLCDFTPKAFSRYRNPEDRRTFTTAGVGAGVAAAFDAPISGLLLAMEDVTSFWGRRIAWQTFFSCGVATLVANLFNVSFTGFTLTGTFGLITGELVEPIQIGVAILVPALVLGLVGGLLGATFTRLNAAIIVRRKRLHARIANIHLQRLAKIGEPIVLVIIMSLAAVVMPLSFGCTSASLQVNDTRYFQQCYWQFQNKTPVKFEAYNCGKSNASNEVYYNEVATLLQQTGLTMLDQLWSRGTHQVFSYGPLLAVLVLWFPVTIWTCGTVTSGGIFVPNLISGALYGRIMGLALIDIYESVTGEAYPLNTRFDWMDPGILATIGSASLLGGVTRLTVASTVIVVELSRDLNVTIPILFAIFVAKLTGDAFSKPFFKYQLEMRNLPYLDQEPEIVYKGQIINLELYRAKHVMASPVCVVRPVELLSTLARLVTATNHSGFPVVKYDAMTRSELAYGVITRGDLITILAGACEDNYSALNDPLQSHTYYPTVSYEEITASDETSNIMKQIEQLARQQAAEKIFVNLEAYVDQSASRVEQHCSLHRTYALFRTLGLRHLLVTDLHNRLTGIITRKDLLSFNIRQRLLRSAEQATPPSAMRRISRQIAVKI